MRWLRTLSRFSDKQPGRPSRRRYTRFVPRFDVLEARAVPTTVTNLNDSGVGSLRYAIGQTPNDGTIDFAPGLTGTITLFSGRLELSKNVNIVGPGADLLRVSGNNNSSVFLVFGAEVTISGITITQGLAQAPPAQYAILFDLTGNPIPIAGGGLFNIAGSVTLNDCIISNNTAPVLGSFGAGIYNWSLPAPEPVIGSITLNNSVLTGNVANSSSGGAIFNEYVYDFNFGFSATSALTIVDSLVISNTGTDLSGGGIYNEGNLTIVNSSVSNNITLLAFTPGLGAGIYNNGVASITRSLIANNVGPSNGGGIYATTNPEPLAPAPSVTLTNSTVSDNKATNSDGGGLWNNGNAITTTNSTIAGNNAARGGGLFLTVGSVPPVTLRNTIIAQNTVSVSGPDVQGQVNNAFSNLIGDGTGSAGLVDQENGNQVGDNFNPINPVIGALKDNGGPTATRALLPGSPAINAGTNTGAPPNDQRGFKRPINTISDIGAYEFQPAGTSTVLASNSNPSIFGQPVTFTATVTGNAEGSNNPQGVVTFRDGGNFLGQASLVNGVASFTTSQLALGTHQITAHYAGFTLGDYVFNPSDSSPLNQLVRSATVTAIKSYTNPANTGDFIMFAATVTGPGGQPTGTVEFFNGVDSLGTAPLEDGVACLSFPPFSFDPGSYTITAQYLGNTTYAPSTSGPLTQVVGATTAVVNATPNPANVVDSITITVTVSKVAPGTQVPTGDVLFLDDGAPIGTAPLNASAQATLTTTFGKGTHNLTAQYLGDTEFTGSTAPGINLVIGASVTLLNSSPNPSNVGQQVLLEALVTPLVGTSPTPGGSVEFFEEGVSLGSGPIVGNVAQLTVTFNTPGNHFVTAVYSGDTNFTSSQSSPLVHVVGANTTSLLVNPSPSAVNQGITLTATVVSDTGGPTPTGTVEFRAFANILGSANLVNGQATLIVSNLPAGIYDLTANYTGDPNYAPSRSGTKQHTVNKAATTTALQVTPAETTFGQQVTFTATLVPAFAGPIVPTGTVTFFDRDNPIATVTLTNGTAVFSSTTLPGGVRYVTAKYSGDSNFLVSTSPVVHQLTQPISFFAIGGAPGKVRFYNPNNTLVVDFAPFPGYTGTINVAIGDVNADGYDDLTVAAGAGNPDVRIYSGKSLSQNPGDPSAALLVQFFAYGLNFNVGAHVATGDINDDGFADLVTGASIGNPDVRVYTGKDIAQGVFNPAGASLIAQWFPYALQFNVGAKVTVGDVNGDGYADVTTGATAGNPDVRVYSGKDIALGTFNPSGASLLAQWFPYALQFNVGANVAIGDVNGDGYGDVITGATIGNPDVRVFSGKDIALGTFDPNGASLLTQFFAYDLNFNIGVTVGAADFNGDGNAEIITGAAGGAPHYRVVAGNSTGIKPPAIFEAVAPDIQGGITVAASSLFLPPPT
jgi:hypothetical protein